MDELKNIISEIKSKNGCNINYKTLQLDNFKSGYMVSIAQYEKTIQLKSIDDLNNLTIQKNVFDAILEKIDIITELRKNNRKNAFTIGAWYNGNDKKLYIDISININSKRDAIKQGVKNNQYCIYDITNGADIPLTQKIYILYKYNHNTNDVQYLYEYKTKSDLIKALNVTARCIEKNVIKSIDALTQQKLIYNKYAVISDDAFIRDLQ